MQGGVQACSQGLARVPWEQAAPCVLPLVNPVFHCRAVSAGKWRKIWEVKEKFKVFKLSGDVCPVSISLFEEKNPEAKTFACRI